MITEDDLAKDLRAGEITVAQLLDRLSGDDVLVYADMALDQETMTWQDVEEAASGSADLFAALQSAGATPEQMDEAGTNVQRLHDAGNTIESRF